MEQDASAWSTEDLVAFIQQMSRISVEQFVREHPHLKKYALAGFSKRLPNDYPLRIARFLVQRAWPNQQDLQKLLDRWRQDHPAVCQAIQALELPLTLDMLGPAIQQYGGVTVLYALRTDPRSERLGDLCIVLKSGLDHGEIRPKPVQPAEPKGSAGKAVGKASPTPVQGSGRPLPSNSKPGVIAPRPAERPTSLFAANGLPKTTAELVAALETQAQTLSAIEQSIATSAAQLAQPATAHNPTALQRAIEKLSGAQQKLSDGLRQFAELESELLTIFGGEIKQAEAAALVEGLAALLPGGAAPATLDEARAHLQAFQQAQERLHTAQALHEERRVALKTAPAAIEQLLNELEGMEGETGPLRANLASLKTLIAERATDEQMERKLQRAEQMQARAIAQRDSLLQSWLSHLQRACRDAELLLHQSPHLSTDLPEVTNLHQALEAARTLLDTPLPLTTPAPLPFEPARLLLSHQTLRKHSERLRQALAAYNPQIALAALEGVEQAPPSPLTPEHLREIGAALVGGASLPAGYSGLIWRVGGVLLTLLDHVTAEQFYERYGYAAVATALAASLRLGDFPLGLTFADHLFYPGAEIGSVFGHPRVVDILSETCASQSLPRLADRCFEGSTSAIRRAGLAFLAQAAVFTLPERLRLQMSAALLAASGAPEERAQAGQLFIRTLLDQGQQLNAYLAWRALALEQPDLYSNPLGLESLYRLLWRLILDAHPPNMHLTALCSDIHLQQAGFYTPGVALALCLGSLALARAGHSLGQELTPLFAEMLRDHHYPAVSDALLAQLPAQPDDSPAHPLPAAKVRDTAVQALSDELLEALAEANRRIQVSNYRFAPTKQMRNQIDTRLRPLLAALQRGEAPASDLLHSLEADDPIELARALIETEEKNRRQVGYDPIEGDDLRKLRKDLENVVKQLTLAVQKRARLVALGVNARKLFGPPEAEAAQLVPGQAREGADQWQPRDEPTLVELRRVLTEFPQARDLLQRALPELVLEAN